MTPYELKAAEERLMEVKMMYANKMVRTVCLIVVFLLSLLMVTCTAQNIYGPNTVKHTIRVKPEEASQWYEKGYSVNWSTDDYYILEREEIVPAQQPVLEAQEDIQMSEGLYNYKAKVIRWIDGDTCELMVDLGFNTHRLDRFRLLGVDAPEMRPQKADFETEELRQAHIDLAKKALLFCEQKCPPDTFITIRTHMDKQGKYGRFLCEIMIGDTTLNRMLIEEGHAKPY